MMEREEKLCPFRAFGPCPEGQCRFWVESMGACALTVQLLRDTEFQAMQKQVEDWKTAAEELGEDLRSAHDCMAEHAVQLESMVPRQELDKRQTELDLAMTDVKRLQKELADARAELEKVRAEGSGRAGGDEKPPKRKRK
jgi:uncharacterized protein (DUF3084 family)